MLEVLEELRQASRIEFDEVLADRRPGDPPRLVANTDRIEKVLGFKASFGLKEIVKSNIEVIRCIWQRQAAIEPSIIKIKASQKSDLFKALYANSITMTPGTVTMEIEGDEFTVHALTRSSREGIESGDMDRRVRSIEH